MLTGSVTGYTMTLQQAEFTGITLTFVFPWQQFWFIMFLSIIFAFFATIGPVLHLAREEISAVFRLNL